MAKKTNLFVRNNGTIDFSDYDYYLDVIETNLKCYKKDFLRNPDNFGSTALNPTDVSSIKTIINNIINNRCPGKVNLVSAELSGSTINVILSGSFGEEAGEITLDKDTGEMMKIYNLENIDG